MVCVLWLKEMCGGKFRQSVSQSISFFPHIHITPIPPFAPVLEVQPPHHPHRLLHQRPQQRRPRTGPGPMRHSAAATTIVVVIVLIVVLLPVLLLLLCGRGRGSGLVLGDEACGVVYASTE